MKKVHLADREEKILRSIIECHVKTAKPVSSGAVVRHGPVRLSSATVRNVMRSLEEQGLILQVNTPQSYLHGKTASILSLVGAFKRNIPSGWQWIPVSVFVLFLRDLQIHIRYTHPQKIIPAVSQHFTGP